MKPDPDLDLAGADAEHPIVNVHSANLISSMTSLWDKTRNSEAVQVQGIMSRTHMTVRITRRVFALMFIAENFAQLQ
jgi:hypothetical protein